MFCSKLMYKGISQSRNPESRDIRKNRKNTKVERMLCATSNSSVPGSPLRYFDIFDISERRTFIRAEH